MIGRDAQARLAVFYSPLHSACGRVGKLFSILLLAVFGLPLVSPMFALGTDADAGVPALFFAAHDWLMAT